MSPTRALADGTVNDFFRRLSAANRTARIVEVAGGNVGVAVLTAISGVILARSLTTTDRGIVALAILWPTFLVTLLSAGNRLAVVYFAANESIERTELTKTALKGAFLSGAATVALGLGASLVWITESTLRSALFVVILAQPFNLVAGVATGLAQADNLRRWNSLRIIGPAIYLLALGSLAATEELSPFSACLAYATSLATAAVVSSKVAIGWTQMLAVAQARARLRTFYGFGLRSTFSTLASTLSSRIDVALLGFFLDLDQVGLYAVAAGSAQVLTPLSAFMVPYLFPAVARIEDAGARKRLRRRSMIATLAVAAPIAVAGAIVARPVVELAFGDRWLDAVPALRILLGASVLQAANGVLTTAIGASGRPEVGGAGQLLGTVATVLVIAPLATEWGIVGAAWASVIAYLATMAYLLWQADSRSV